MNYRDYLERYTGSEAIPEKDFEFYREKAQGLLRDFTYGRSDDCDLDEVMYAAVEIAQLLFEGGSRRGIVSESNDALSVTYSEGYDDVKEAYKIARSWLGNTGLMYSGVDMQL